MRRFVARGLSAGLAVLGLAACNTDRLNVPNFSNPSTESIKADPAAALPLLATGVLRDDRGGLDAYVRGVGILGREVYNYTPTEGRNHSGWVETVRDPASFGGVALWFAPYNTLRDNKNLLQTIEAGGSGLLSTAQVNAGRGFSYTMEAMQLNYIIQTRDTLGAVVELADDPREIQPFVSRDSVYARIIARLDAGAAALSAGGAAFPFTLHSGYAGFNTPATYRQFNRGLAARINAYRASRGIGPCAGATGKTSCYNAVLTNLSESFLSTTGSLATGVYNVYSAASGDFANSNSNQATVNIVAHAGVNVGVKTKADGQPDDRFTAKVTTLATPKQASNAQIGIPSSYDWLVYTLRTSPIPIIRNEELILLRAEARYYTGDLVGAVADLNTIRTRAGGLAPITVADVATEATFLDELLYNRRYSLAFEGHRWIDMRRFNRLNQLPLDLPSHIVVQNLPVPQAECLARSAQTGPAMRGPGC